MMWVIQKNLLNDEAYWRFTMAFDEMGIPWRPIKVTPFADELTDFEGIENPVVFYGSTSLQRQVLNHGKFFPAVWGGANFDYMLHIEKYGKHMLNHDAQVYPFKDIPEFDGVLFMRPVYDNKSFSGTLVGGDEFQTWKNNILGISGWTDDSDYDGFMETWKSPVMTPYTPTLVTSPKNVRFEFRFFVVGGKVVTGSLYHTNDRLTKRPLVDNALDRRACQFAQDRVDEWVPADAFVMDIGVLEDDRGMYDFRIVEINSFNCSGIYECDVKSIIRAVESLPIFSFELHGEDTILDG